MPGPSIDIASPTSKARQVMLEQQDDEQFLIDMHESIEASLMDTKRASACNVDHLQKELLVASWLKATGAS